MRLYALFEETHNPAERRIEGQFLLYSVLLTVFDHNSGDTTDLKEPEASGVRYSDSVREQRGRNNKRLGQQGLMLSSGGHRGLVALRLIC